MKYILVIFLSLTIIGCGATGSKRTDGMLVGGALGGLAGHQVGGGRGKTAATIGGALLGAWLGSAVGEQMDERDKLLADRSTRTALETLPVGSAAGWKNPDNGHTGVIKPTKTVIEADGTPCREYTHTVFIGNKHEKMYGTACRQSDGSWKNQ